MARDYHNEFDPFAAQWLRNLIAEGLLPPGDVDERSIVDVRPADLAGYTRCHFFSGIGGWPLALRLAGWPNSRECWTGSCPCPPFSAAGKGQQCPDCGSKRNLCHPRKTGHFICLDCGSDRKADDRHLWPEFSRLIRECRPPVIFGEQVASADGRLWLDVVSADLRLASYGVAGADICAAGIGAPHIRQRLWWVADANGGHTSAERQQSCWEHGQQQAHRISRELADAVSAGWPQRRPGTGIGPASGSGGAGELADAPGEHRARRVQEPSGEPCAGGQGMPAGGRGDAGIVGDAGRAGLALGSFAKDQRRALRVEGAAPGATEPLRNPWSDAEWIWCRDGKHRPTQPGLFPLAHGVSGRVGRLRAYGNAIVPPLAAEFIRAYLECRPEGGI